MSDAQRQPVVALIAARARNGVIGREGGLPWRLPEDMRYFRRVTMGKPVLMGRKTWDSIGKPLPGRANIVVSRDAGFAAPGATVVGDVEAACAEARRAALAAGVDEIMVIGGEAIYRACLPLAGRLYLTEVEAEVEGDARFPDFRTADWRLASSIPGKPETPVPFTYRFDIWERISPSES